MRGTVSKYRVVLKPKQRRRLSKVVARRKPSHWLVIRARVVLMAGESRTIFEICAALSLDRQVVRRWCKRFLLLGFEGLERVAGSRQALVDRLGRPPRPLQVETLVDQDPVGPTEKAARSVERVELLVDLDERVLHRVTRLVSIAEHSERHGEEHALMLRDQALERGGVACEAATHESMVFGILSYIHRTRRKVDGGSNP